METIQEGEKEEEDEKQESEQLKEELVSINYSDKGGVYLKKVKKLKKQKRHSE